jgi:transposase-like protein
LHARKKSHHVSHILGLNARRTEQLSDEATREASKRWSMPIHNWRAALNHFMVVVEDRLADYI